MRRAPMITVFGPGLTIGVMVLATMLAGNAAASSICRINGVDQACGEDGPTLTTLNGNPAYQFTLTDIGSGFSDLYMTGIGGTFESVTASFTAYVPGPAVNGAFSNLAPYVYFTVNPYGTNFAGGDPYALVIASNSGFGNFVNDGFYQDGIGPNSTVHVVLSNWSSAQAGITNPDWLTCCTISTLSTLMSTTIPASGSNPSMTWGELNVYKARVATGDWGGSGGPYTAYVSAFDVTPAPDPGVWESQGQGLLR